MYQPLADYLRRQPGCETTLSYDDIERILGRELPRTAYGDHVRQWWANTKTHSQALAWLEVGWRARVDVVNKRVFFTRVSAGEGAHGTSPKPEPDQAVWYRHLTAAGRRLIEDYCEELGVTAEEAAVAIINAAAQEHRKRLISWFAANSPNTASDSAELIREDRDGG
jgi:hypothetical protein